MISLSTIPQFAIGIKLNIGVSSSIICKKYGSIGKNDIACSEDWASLNDFDLPASAIHTPEIN